MKSLADKLLEKIVDEKKQSTVCSPDMLAKIVALAEQAEKNSRQKQYKDKANRVNFILQQLKSSNPDWSHIWSVILSSPQRDSDKEMQKLYDLIETVYNWRT